MYYRSFGSVPIDVSSCWSAFKPESQKKAEEINAIIDKFPHATQQLAIDFQAIMEETKKAGLCPFVAGSGPIIERSNQIYQQAQNIAANPPPLPTPTPSAPVATSAVPLATPTSVAPPVDFFDPGPTVIAPQESGGGAFIIGLVIILAIVGAGAYFYLR